MPEKITPSEHTSPVKRASSQESDGHGPGSATPHIDVTRAAPESTVKPAPIAGIYAHHLDRLLKLLRERLPLVLESHWYFEDQTGYYNETGAHNLSDALSHIGTLAERAPQLSDREQGEQITQIEDHLRRSMMEGFESVVDSFLASTRNECWAEYILSVSPLVGKGKLAGASSSQELAAYQRRIERLQRDGRAKKRGTSWEEFEEGAGAFREAADAARELHDRLAHDIALARQYRRDRRNLRLAILGITATVILGVAGIIAAWR